MRVLTLTAGLSLYLATPLLSQGIPENAHRVSWGKGWECNREYVDRGDKCVSLGRATDQEIRRYLVRQSIRSYSGNCPCPFNRDRAGRRCGGRSAYSRPGGASPLCYPSDISDRQVEAIRNRYAPEHTQPDTTLDAQTTDRRIRSSWCSTEPLVFHKVAAAVGSQ